MHLDNTPRPGPFSANAVSEASLVLDHENGRGATSQHPSQLDPAMSPPKVMTPNSCAVMVDHSPRAHRAASVLISDPRGKTRTGHEMQAYAHVANRRVEGVTHIATAEGESVSSLRTKQGCVGTQQNADKFRACARAPSASAVPPASGIAPLRVWRTVNVHPSCLLVNTLSSSWHVLCSSGLSSRLRADERDMLNLTGSTEVTRGRCSSSSIREPTVVLASQARNAAIDSDRVAPVP